MLVLARKMDESILIGDNIVVKVVSVDNGIVKIGIEAPKEVSIMRDELIQEVKASNQAASHKAETSEISELSKLLGKLKEVSMIRDELIQKIQASNITASHKDAISDISELSKLLGKSKQ